MQKQGDMTPPKVSNDKTKDLNESKGDEILNVELKRMMIRKNEMKEDISKCLHEMKENVNKQLNSSKRNKQLNESKEVSLS
jgi:hypothetical protein